MYGLPRMDGYPENNGSLFISCSTPLTNQVQADNCDLWEALTRSGLTADRRTYVNRRSALDRQTGVRRSTVA